MFELIVNLFDANQGLLILQKQFYDFRSHEASKILLILFSDNILIRF